MTETATPTHHDSIITQLQHATAAIDKALAGHRANFRRAVLTHALHGITPEMETAEEKEDYRIMAALLGCTPDVPKPQLRLDKAHDDGVPLVRWLLARDPTAKLAAIVADALIGSDIERNMKDAGAYDGSLGDDIRQDWERDVVRMIDAPDTPPEDRAVAAWIMGVITAT